MHGPLSLLATLLLTAALGLCACTGSMVEPLGASSSGVGVQDPVVRAANCEERQAGPGAFRRLTRAEYAETVQDLLQDAAPEVQTFVADSLEDGFTNNLKALPDVRVTQQYNDAAEAIATRAVAKLGSWFSCNVAQQTEATCAQIFVRTVGSKAFRRPVKAEEESRLLAVYDFARVELGYAFPQRLRLVLTAMLSSASFLYHVEKGKPPKPGDTYVPLADHELASRLSYFLVGGPPDAELWAAATAGTLSDAAELDKHARRLWQSPRAKAAMTRFHRQWLELDSLDSISKDESLFPEFTAELRQAMKAETEAFVRSVLWDGDGRLHTLLTSTQSFANAPLASLYGLSGVTGTALQSVSLDPTQRAGMLTQPAFLATHAHRGQTSPTRRGLFVRERMLCAHMDSPPEGVDVTVPTLDPSRTTRERYAAHQTERYCAGCHRLMDNMGLGMESLDAVGRYRTHEAGRPLDSSGEVVDTGELDGPFNGLPELARRLGNSQQVRDCATTKWFTYALGRPEAEEDACTVAKLKVTFRRSDQVPELVFQLIQSHAFRHIRVPAQASCR